MYHRFKIQQTGLMTIARPFVPDQTILLKDIRFVEVYGKSIVPPLVIAISLTAAQAILLATGKFTMSPGLVSNGLPLPILNIPIILCILLALIRARYVTLKITVEGKERLLHLHFVSRTSGEKLVNEFQTIIKNTDKAVARAD